MSHAVADVVAEEAVDEPPLRAADDDQVGLAPIGDLQQPLGLAADLGDVLDVDPARR